MSKKVLVLTLIILLGLSVGVFGGKKPGDDRSFQNLEKVKQIKENIALKYLTTPEPKMLIPMTNDTLGYTYWDVQHNNIQRRMIAKGADPKNCIHFTWMNLTSPPIGEERFVYYNSYCPTDGWLVVGGMYVTLEGQGGGYTGLDLLPDQREVLCYHRNQPETLQLFWGTTISIERAYPGDGTFASYDIPDSILGKRVKGMYPTAVCSKLMNGDTSYIHITHTQFIPGGGIWWSPTSADPDIPPAYPHKMRDRDPTGDPKDLGYVRCFEKPGINDTLVCMSPGWGTPLKIKKDTKLVPNKVPYKFAVTRLGGTAMATSPVSQKVCIAWLQNTTSANSLTRNEVKYLESTQNGNDWIANPATMYPVQITYYADKGYADRAYPDIAAVYDYNDNLHLVWTTFKSTNQNDVTLWHWSASTGIRRVSSAIASSAVDPGTWNLLIAKFNLGIYQPDNTLYLTYTKFQDGDTSLKGYANGDIFVKGTTNSGLTWGPEVNLTNTNSNGCTPGNCKSEHWSSLAERVDDFLHIQYIHDLDAGGAPQYEGTMQYDSVIYLKYPRFTIPAIASITYTPTSMADPPKSAVNGGSTSQSMQFDNVGTSTLYAKLSSGATWVTMNPNQFSIVEAGPTQNVNVTLSGAGFTDTVMVDSIKIESNDGSVGEVYTSVKWVRIHFVVSDSFYYATWDTVTQGDFKVVVSNVGNSGHQTDGYQFNYKNHDYVFDCTPVFVTPDFYGVGPAGFTYLNDHHDFIAGPKFPVKTYPNLGVTVVYDLFGLHPYRLPFPYHEYWPWLTHESKTIIYHDGGRVYIQFKCSWQTGPRTDLSYWFPVWWPWLPGQEPEPPTGKPSEGYFGIAADFDVPGDASSRNLGGYVDSLNLIYQYCDSAGFTNYYGGFMFLGSRLLKEKDPDSVLYNYTTPLGAHVLNNATQLYPFRGYNTDSLLKYMPTSGWSVEQDSAQDMNILMSFLPGLTQLTYPDRYELEYEFAILLTDQGLNDLVNMANLKRKFMAGNANRDNKVSVSDVVYLINYLFKGGPEPLIAYSDANGDKKISVSDVVYLINYLFKGGSAPILIWSQEEPF